MIGSKAMNLHGWRQLIEWSIKHASLDSGEREELRNIWKPLWDTFIGWINEAFKDIQLIMDRPARPSRAKKNGETDGAWQKRIGSEKSRYEYDEAKFQDQVKQWRARAAKPQV
jgi:hypothetical protein